MPAFPEHRRSPPDIEKIRPGMGADRQQIVQFEDRCRQVGLKMTDLRRVLLHSILAAGPGATAVGIWKTVAKMVYGHAPSQGSLQRNLNLMVKHGVLLRDVGADRVWRYRVTLSSQRVSPAITFLDAGTGGEIACHIPEAAALLSRMAAERGLLVYRASITVMPLDD